MKRPHRAGGGASVQRESEHTPHTTAAAQAQPTLFEQLDATLAPFGVRLRWLPAHWLLGVADGDRLLFACVDAQTRCANPATADLGSLAGDVPFRPFRTEQDARQALIAAGVDPDTIFSKREQRQ